MMAWGTHKRSYIEPSQPESPRAWDKGGSEWNERAGISRPSHTHVGQSL